MHRAVTFKRSPWRVVSQVATALGVLLATSSTPAAAGNEHVVLVTRAPPPAALHEPVPNARKGNVWSRGYWIWNGIHYKWVPGEWVKERSGQKWESARWQTDGVRWQFVVGHWRPAASSS